MRTLRSRLIFSHILPFLIVVPLAGLAFIYLLETQLLLTDISQSLADQAGLIADATSYQPGIWQDTATAGLFIATFADGSGAQLMLLQPDGYLLAASDPAYQDRVGQALDLPAMNALGDGETRVHVVIHRVRGVAEVMVPVTNANEQVVGIVRATEQLSDLSSRLWQLRGFVAGIVVAELLLGALVGLVLALRLERPLRAVTAAVTDLAGGGRTGPVPEQGPAEIRQLVRSVNQLAGRLALLEEMRRRLLANLVHELGRPLGALRSAVHALLGGADEDSALRHELLAGMDAELRYLQPLLDDLSRLHEQVLGLPALERRPTDVDEWLISLLPAWREAARAKDLTWSDEIPPDLPALAIDPRRLAQGVGNLISNAIKYTRPGGAVRVEAGQNDSELWIRVGDTGPGVPPEERERIFEPFYRGTQEERFPQGLGLGLTIARDLVVAHGGRLTVDGRAGEGSRFTIYLPL